MKPRSSYAAQNIHFKNQDYFTLKMQLNAILKLFASKLFCMFFLMFLGREGVFIICGFGLELYFSTLKECRHCVTQF